MQRVLRQCAILCREKQIARLVNSGHGHVAAAGANFPCIVQLRSIAYNVAEESQTDSDQVRTPLWLLISLLVLPNPLGSCLTC